MGKRLIATVTLLLSFTALSFGDRVNLHGGITKTKKLSLGEIERYRTVSLLRRRPLCYAPWKAYLAVSYNTEVRDMDNYNALIVKADIANMVRDDAKFNKAFAKRFQGKSIKSIYRYVRRTDYVLHKKTAREVFTERKGDCAGQAAAVYVICKVNNIPVRYIIGWHRNTCHAYNRVKWRGKWYYMDCAMGRYLSRKLWKHYSIMEMW